MQDLLLRAAVRILLVELYPQRPQSNDEQRPVKELLEDFQTMGFKSVRHVGYILPPHIQECKGLSDVRTALVEG